MLFLTECRSQLETAGLLAQLLLAIMMEPTSVNSSKFMKDVLVADEEHWGQVSDAEEKISGVISITVDGCCC